MNVLFHITAAAGIAVLVTDTDKITKKTPIVNTIATAALAFVIGVVSHGALDYIPHCYPIPSKVDILVGLACILAFVYRADYPYKLIVLCSCVGSIFPDLVDLLPTMLNKYLGWTFFMHDNFFPWHWKIYSGSLYQEDCFVSNINHALVVLVVAVFLWVRKKDLSSILKLN